MGKLPKSKDKMIRAIIESDAVYMVAFKNIELGDETKPTDQPYEVRNLSHEISIAQLPVVISSASRFVTVHMEYVLLNYARMLRKEQDDAKENNVPDAGAVDAGSADGDGADGSSQLEMYSTNDGDVPGSVRVGSDSSGSGPDVGSTRNDT